MLNAETIEQLTNIVIRPHRQIYTVDKLGPRKIVVKSVISGRYIQVIRKQATLVNQGKKLQLSLFQPETSSHEETKGWHSPSNHKKQNFQQFQYKSTILSNEDIFSNKQCSIFLHSNSGSRLEGLQYIKYLLQYNHNVCIFDYSGSGLSQGDYVTMGLNQCQDLKRIVHFLKDRYNISQFTLWGRSMGAVTALMYASLEPFRVSRMVLDSPFSNFRQLVKQIVNARTGLPDFLFGSILERIQEQIIKKTSHNLMEIDLRKNVKEKGMNLIRCMFLISKDDKLVKPVHVQTLHSLYEGPKQIVYLQGSHNKPRSHDVRENCSKFLCGAIPEQKSQQKFQPVSLANHRRGSQTGLNIQAKTKKMTQSIIINEGNEVQKKIHNSPKGFSKLIPESEKNIVPTISTQRQENSLGKLNSGKVSLSQLKRNACLIRSTNGIGSSFKKSEQMKTKSRIFQSKEHETIQEASKDDANYQMKNGKQSMMAAKYKNKLKEQLKKK